MNGWLAGLAGGLEGFANAGQAQLDKLWEERKMKLIEEQQMRLQDRQNARSDFEYARGRKDKIADDKRKLQEQVGVKSWELSEAEKQKDKEYQREINSPEYTAKVNELNAKADYYRTGKGSSGKAGSQGLQFDDYMKMRENLLKRYTGNDIEGGIKQVPFEQWNPEDKQLYQQLNQVLGLGGSQQKPNDSFEKLLSELDARQAAKENSKTMPEQNAGLIEREMNKPMPRPVMPAKFISEQGKATRYQSGVDTWAKDPKWIEYQTKLREWEAVNGK